MRRGCERRSRIIEKVEDRMRGIVAEVAMPCFLEGLEGKRNEEKYIFENTKKEWKNRTNCVMIY